MQPTGQQGPTQVTLPLDDPDAPLPRSPEPPEPPALWLPDAAVETPAEGPGALVDPPDSPPHATPMAAQGTGMDTTRMRWNSRASFR
jgi:hypothetical protein